jgi:NosR/NirI family transcriptional regulator, nitrous oxide reductase regulator
MDVGVLAAAMGISSWLVLKRRSRKALVALAIGSVAYFGFYREGCVCPIGSIQNVAVALTDPRVSIPMVVTATFFLPLVMAVFFGRAFCGGVCALGALQELVLMKPVQVPRRLDRALGLLKYVYLGLALFFALKPAATRDFVICRFDPFVASFAAPAHPHAADRRRFSVGRHVHRTAVLPLPLSLRRPVGLVYAIGPPRSHHHTRQGTGLRPV